MMRVLPWRMHVSTALLSILLLALASACGEGDGQLVSSNGGTSQTQHGDQTDDGIDKPMTPQLARDYIMNQDAVIMPWTREISGPLLEQAEVDEDQIRFARDGNQDTVGAFEPGDVLVSADADKPFLRKITDIEVVDEQYVVHTRNAKLGEAVYKGSLNTAEQTAGQRGEPLRGGDLDTRQQFLEPERESFGHGSTNEEDTDARENESAPVQFSISPSVTVTPSFYFDLKIDPTTNRNENHNHFWSPHQRCPNGDASYCDPQVGGPNMRYESYCGSHQGTANVCQFRQQGFHASCDTVVGALNYAEKHPDCKALFEKFYNGDLGQDAYASRHWNNSACDYWGYGYWLPPHPVHMDWAKEHCQGAVKRAVVDAQVEATASTGEIGIEATQEWSSEDPYTIWESEPRPLARKVFFIGWLPVLITSNGSLRLEAEVEAKVTGSLTFEGITLRGLTFGRGFAKYASDEYEDNKGVYVDGRFELYSRGIRDGKWRTTPPRSISPRLEGLELKNKEVLATLEGTMTGKIAAIPRVDLLLYNLAGPYVEPLTPYGEIQLSAGGSVSSLDGVREGGGTCTNSAANICARVGATGSIGITAANICDGCDWQFPLDYDTCSDYCPSNDQPLCAKWCYADDSVKPVKVVLQWTSDSLDLDLSMTSPSSCDYQDRTPTRDGWVHSGDTCPTSFGGTCNDSPQAGYYTESFWLDPQSSAPGNSALYSIDVKTFNANSSGGSYNLLVYENGQRKKTFTGQPAPAKGDTATTQFTLR